MAGELRDVGSSPVFGGEIEARSKEFGEAYAGSANAVPKGLDTSFSGPADGKEPYMPGGFVLRPYDGADIASSLVGERGAMGATVSSGGFSGGGSPFSPAAPAGVLSGVSAAGFATDWGVLVSILSILFGAKLLWDIRRRIRPESLPGLPRERPG